MKQLTKEYKCINDNLLMYFVKANSLLKKFEKVEIKHVPRIENHDTNDLDHIALGYRVPKEILEELIKVKHKLISNNISALELSKTKLAKVEELGDLNPNFFETFSIDNFLMMRGGNKSWSSWKIQQELQIERLDTRL